MARKESPVVSFIIRRKSVATPSWRELNLGGQRSQKQFDQ
jgi:hypothetical protein